MQARQWVAVVWHSWQGDVQGSQAVVTELKKLAAPQLTQVLVPVREKVAMQEVQVMALVEQLAQGDVQATQERPSSQNPGEQVVQME
jgi:hypothetical protein